MVKGPPSEASQVPSGMCALSVGAESAKRVARVKPLAALVPSAVISALAPG